MTLIVALPARDGLVFASDGQYTSGVVRYSGAKILELNDRALWAGSGEIALIQRVRESLEQHPGRHQPLEVIRDSWANIIRQCVQKMLELDFRTQFFATNPSALLQLHPADFLFVEFLDRARILHILSNGTPEWVEPHFAVTGSGDLFAHALLRKFASRELTVERAKILAYKVIEEAIEVGAYGLGSPISIWRITREGAGQTGAEELALLEDTVGVIREAEVASLLGEESEANPEQLGDEGA